MPPSSGGLMATQAGMWAPGGCRGFGGARPPNQEADFTLVVKGLQKNVNGEHEELVTLASLETLMQMTATKEQKNQAFLSRIGITSEQVMQVAAKYLKNVRPAVHSPGPLFPGRIRHQGPGLRTQHNQYASGPRIPT